MENEVWVDVKNYEGRYQISNMGRVRSVDTVLRNTKNSFMLKKGSLKKSTDNGKGYQIVSLSKNGRKNHYVHRLVAFAFIENPMNYLEVNHKDCNKKNNKACNLEWCNRVQNLKHAVTLGRTCNNRKHTMPVIGINKLGEKTTYESILQASLKTGAHKDSIRSCCIGRIKTAGGIKWEYADKEFAIKKHQRIKKHPLEAIEKGHSISKFKK